jgi:hypothetical protein
MTLRVASVSRACAVNTSEPFCGAVGELRGASLDRTLRFTVPCLLLGIDRAVALRICLNYGYPRAISFAPRLINTLDQYLPEN